MDKIDLHWAKNFEKFVTLELDDYEYVVSFKKVVLFRLHSKLCTPKFDDSIKKLNWERDIVYNELLPQYSKLTSEIDFEEFKKMCAFGFVLLSNKYKQFRVV